jgi:hypothetical protein
MSMDYFSCSGGPGTVCINSALGHYAELIFLHLVGFVGQEVHSGAFGP